MCEMSLLGLSKLPWAQKGIICTGLVWGRCYLCEISLLGLSKLPWAQRGVICAGLIGEAYPQPNPGAWRQDWPSLGLDRGPR